MDGRSESHELDLSGGRSKNFAHLLLQGFTPTSKGLAVMLTTSGIAERLGVKTQLVLTWRHRYRDTDHPCPEPDMIAGRTAVWAEERLEEWRQWLANRPGQGAGGGRPIKSHSEDT